MSGSGWDQKLSLDRMRMQTDGKQERVDRAQRAKSEPRLWPDESPEHSRGRWQGEEVGSGGLGQMLRSLMPRGTCFYRAGSF